MGSIQTYETASVQHETSKDYSKFYTKIRKLHMIDRVLRITRSVIDTSQEHKRQRVFIVHYFYCFSCCMMKKVFNHADSRIATTQCTHRV